MAKEKKHSRLKRKVFFSFLTLVLFFLILFNLWGLIFLRQLKKPHQASVTPTPTPVLPASLPVTLIVTGDVMLARSVTAKMRDLADFSYPFSKTANFLKNADLTLINLESPLGTDCPSTDAGMRFCADYQALEGLIRAGVDLASLANNHALDQGETGLKETEVLLKENFITPVGLKEPVFRQVNGVQLVFLAYNSVVPESDLVSWAYPDVVQSEIRRFSQEADLVIVYFHWGKEYAATPMAGGGSASAPQELAHLAVEAGADLVLGSHPHVVWENERYQEKLIVYSLGNFVFDQSWSQETREGVVGKFVLAKDGLIEAEFLPVKIDGYQPHFLTTEEN